VDPLDVFRDFMLVPDILERKWASLRDTMLNHGIQESRLAITELQMFAHLGPASQKDEENRLNHQNLVNPGTLAEALYDTLIYHGAVRLQPFVELITHSATVNHGGGLRKERERVYANPCHYANLLFANFAGAKPVKLELAAPAEQAPKILPDIKSAGDASSFSVIDAIAARTTNGELLVSIVHRGTRRTMPLAIRFSGFSAASTAQVTTLSGPAPWSVNSLESPELIQPQTAQANVKDDSIHLELPPFSLAQLRLLPKP
jgi:alpha-N-arabinofuranosidase